MRNELIIVIPFYNEETRSLKNKKYWDEIFSTKGIDFILVNDGSTDETKFEINHFANRFTNVQALNHKKNSGKTNAIITGMKTISNSKVTMIGFMDGDCAISIEDLRNIHEIAKKKLLTPELGSHFESIWSSRVSLAGRYIDRTILRKWVSRLIATIFGFIDGDLPYDTQCGLKVYLNATDFIEVLSHHKFRTRWFFDLELHLALESHRKIRVGVWEEPLEKWADNDGSNLIKIKTFFQISKEIFFVMYLLFRNKVAQKKHSK